MVKKYLRKLMKWAMSSDHDAPQPEEVTSYHGNSVKSMNGSGLNDRNNGMNFTVFNATGGKVVQFATYDPVRDRHQSNLYVVTDREDLGEELAQIITRESLSR
jgi:hypothetical protein